jgi:hypothetical protein
MDGKRETVHERWMQRTEAAYRRMFEGKSQEELVTLAQRENMAVLIGKELGISAPGQETTSKSFVRAAQEPGFRMERMSSASSRIPPAARIWLSAS